MGGLTGGGGAWRQDDDHRHCPDAQAMKNLSMVGEEKRDGGVGLGTWRCITVRGNLEGCSERRPFLEGKARRCRSILSDHQIMPMSRHLRRIGHLALQLTLHGFAGHPCCILDCPVSTTATQPFTTAQRLALHSAAAPLSQSGSSASSASVGACQISGSPVAGNGDDLVIQDPAAEHQVAGQNNGRADHGKTSLPRLQLGVKPGAPASLRPEQPTAHHDAAYQPHGSTAQT